MERLRDALDGLTSASWLSAPVQAVQQAAASVRDLAAGILDQALPAGVLKRARQRQEEVLASWRWGSRSFGVQMRLPISMEFDERLLLLLVEAVRASAAHLSNCPPGRAHLFPVSTSLLFLNLGVFYRPGGVLLREVCLSPFCVVERHELHRLATSALCHVDLTHLVNNLATALPDCIYLESSLGSAHFALDLGLLTAMSHALYVGAAWLEHRLLGSPANYYSVGAVGLSSVAFALKVVAGQRQACTVWLFGVPLPSNLAWLPYLAVTHIAVPEASFPAHVCGVLAGVVQAYLVRPLLWGLGLRPPPQPLQYEGGAFRGRSRTWGGGSGGSSRAAGFADGWRQPSPSPWRRYARELAIQLGLCAASAAVYYAVSRTGARAQRQPLNQWRLR